MRYSFLAIGIIFLVLGYLLGIGTYKLQCAVNDADIKNCIAKANDYNKQYLTIINNRLNCEQNFTNPVQSLDLGNATIVDLGNPYANSVVQP